MVLCSVWKVGWGESSAEFWFSTCHFMPFTTLSSLSTNMPHPTKRVKIAIEFQFLDKDFLCGIYSFQNTLY